MIVFAKFILDKMSFNENLFLKELKKLIIWAESENKEELKIWCMNNYGDLYREKIIQTFNTTRRNLK